ncbi:sulfotransferase 1C2 isoform X1 [Dermacentor silvarum]|nr:sulfotransferase 1C2 isoform X1 [Dermacentor silvarum]
MSTALDTPSPSTVTKSRRPFYRMIDGVPKCAWLDPDIYRENSTFRAAKGDVVQSSFPKSGAHWVQYVTQLILKGGEPVNSYDEFACNGHFLEYVRHDGWKPALPMRLFYTHQMLKPNTLSEDAKYVYVARNPWDVCVSLYHAMTELSVWRFQDATFDELFDAFLETDFGYGSYFEHVASGYALKDKPNVFFLTYEELKRDTRGMVLRLAHFLGDQHGKFLDENEVQLNKIVELSKPEHTRKVILVDLQASHSPEIENLIRRNQLSCKTGYDGDTRKYSLVREGKVGGWIKHFSPQQLARLEKKIQEEQEVSSFMELWKDIRAAALEISSPIRS